MKHDVADLSLASGGKKRILWADNDMPVLASIRQRFAKNKPLKGMNISACLHVTAETANLMRALKAGGANAVLCASNPLSTQDDVAASLVKDFKIPVFAVCGEGRKTYYDHINADVNNGTVTQESKRQGKSGCLPIEPPTVGRILSHVHRRQRWILCRSQHRQNDLDQNHG